MLDQCTIVADAEIFADDTFDTTTGEWTRDPADDSPVYAGKCLIKYETSTATNEGGQDMAIEGYVARIPLAVVNVTPGMGLVCTDSRDLFLIGHRWKIDTVIGGTFKVARGLVLSEIASEPRQFAEQT